MQPLGDMLQNVEDWILEKLAQCFEEPKKDYIAFPSAKQDDMYYRINILRYLNEHNMSIPAFYICDHESVPYDEGVRILEDLCKEGRIQKIYSRPESEIVYGDKNLCTEYAGNSFVPENPDLLAVVPDAA